MSVLDASWAPQTPIPAVGMLGTRRILTQDDYGSRYARRGATALTEVCFELDNGCSCVVTEIGQRARSSIGRLCEHRMIPADV